MIAENFPKLKNKLLFGKRKKCDIMLDIVTDDQITIGGTDTYEAGLD